MALSKEKDILVELIAKLELKPEDVLVLKTKELTEDAELDILARVESMGIKNKILVLQDDVELSVVSFKDLPPLPVNKLKEVIIETVLEDIKVSGPMHKKLLTILNPAGSVEVVEKTRQQVMKERYGGMVNPLVEKQ